MSPQTNTLPVSITTDDSPRCPECGEGFPARDRWGEWLHSEESQCWMNFSGTAHMRPPAPGDHVRNILEMDEESALAALDALEGMDIWQLVRLLSRVQYDPRALDFDRWCEVARSALAERIVSRSLELEPGLDPEVLDWDEDEDAEPAVDWLLEGIVARGDCMSLFGPAEVGKSLLMLDWALQMVRRGFRVLYLDKENAPAILKRRLKKMGATSAERASLMVLPFVALPDLATQEGAGALAEKVERYRADVVVLDTISKFSSYGQASQSDRWQNIYNLSFLPLLARGVTVIQLDHVGHANRDRERDSSAKRDNVSVAWALAAASVKDRDRLVLTRVKNRDRKPGPDSLAVVREDVPLLRHVIGQAVPDDIRAALEDLEKADVPAGAGRPTARKLLEDKGFSMSDRVLEAALRVRKAGQ